MKTQTTPQNTTTWLRRLALLLLLPLLSFGAPLRAQAADTISPEWFSLQGTPVKGGNAPDEQGLVRQFDAAVLGVTRTTRPDSLGTVLLLPGGGYSILDVLNEGARTAAALNNFGYDVVMLEYHVGAGVKSRPLALEDALAAWRLLMDKPEALGIKGRRRIVMGYSAGGHLATRMVQEMPEKEQPDDVVLVYPAYLNEMAAGTQLPTVQPPAHPRSRLVAIMAADDRATWLKGCRDYVDAWRKAGGEGLMFQFKEGGHGFGMKPGLTGDLAQWPKILNYFLENGPKPGVGPFNMVLPWFLPNRDGRLAKFKADQTADQGAVVFLGDSITSKWKLEQAFPEYKIANRGIAGDTTRGMLVRSGDNVLALHPKAMVFLGGINDLFGPGTPETIGTNLRSILELVRKASDMPIFVCEVLPCKGRPSELVRATNAALAKVAGDFTNVHLVKTYAPLLKPDGTQDETLFLDGTHPNEAGYAVLQQNAFAGTRQIRPTRLTVVKSVVNQTANVMSITRTFKQMIKIMIRYKKYISRGPAVMSLLVLLSGSPLWAQTHSRERISIDSDWRFFKDAGTRTGPGYVSRGRPAGHRQPTRSRRGRSGYFSECGQACVCQDQRLDDVHWRGFGD